MLLALSLKDGSLNGAFNIGFLGPKYGSDHWKFHRACRLNRLTDSARNEFIISVGYSGRWRRRLLNLLRFTPRVKGLRLIRVHLLGTDQGIGLSLQDIPTEYPLETI